MMATPVALVVFDLDGTLVDSKRDLADAANAVLIECGAAPLPEGTIARMVGDGAATLVARVFATAGIAQPPDALARFLDYVKQHDKVWVCRRVDIARHWREHHPYRAA